MTHDIAFYEAAKSATLERSTTLEKSVRGIGVQLRNSLEAAPPELDEKIMKLLQKLDATEMAAMK
ncbi:hypothetical protein [Ochrobactrum teleogrylli]